MTDEDSVLVKRARNGDIRAFEELVDRHRAVVSGSRLGLSAPTTPMT